MLGALQAKQKLNLRSIGLLITSFTVLIVLGRAIVGEIGLVAVLNASWTPEALGAFLFALPLVGYATVGLGVAVFVYYGFRTHFQVDRFAVKKQLKKTLAISSLVLCGLFLSSLVTTPLVSAGTTATTGYYLATPYSPFDWLVGKYSTGACYAINGSNWANLMTFPTTTWAAYADNASKVQELVLAATTAGTVYLKEVAFDYDCTIPENVQVIENVNGLTRTFVDDSESQGSPYTVSVDTVNPTYYTVQDCADRYIISWTSTNASYVFNLALAGGKYVKVLEGNYTISSPIVMNTNNWLDGVGCGSMVAGTDVYATKLFLTEAVNVITATGSGAGSLYGVHISNIEIYGNNLAGNGVHLDGVVYPILENLYIYNCSYGVRYVAAAADSSVPYFNNLVIKNCATDGILFSSVSDGRVSNCDIGGNLNNLRFSACSRFTLSNNHIYSAIQRNLVVYGGNTINIGSFRISDSLLGSILIYNSAENITLSNGEIDNSNTARAYAGITLTDCNGVTIQGVTIKDYTSNSIVETGTVSRNMIIGVNADDEIITIGENTKVNLCWNATAWIT